MKKQIRLILNIILVLVMAFALVQFINSEIDNRRSQEDYALAKEIAAGQPTEEPSATVPQTEPPTEPPTEPLTEPQEETEVSEEALQETEAPTQSAPADPVIEELLAIDLDALRHENEDVIGWIHIPGTRISYPLLQWIDNDFYLEHTWTQSSNASGAIFMEYQNKPDFSEFNTIIYGHNMRNGDMFGTLQYYRSPEYWQKRPYVYIVNDDGVLRFDIFAVQSASTQSILYGLGLETDQRKEEFIRFAKDYSLIETEIFPTVDDRILTLSTCTGQGHTYRWVVQSVLNEEASYKRPQ